MPRTRRIPPRLKVIDARDLLGSDSDFKPFIIGTMRSVFEAYFRVKHGLARGVRFTTEEHLSTCLVEIEKCMQRSLAGGDVRVIFRLDYEGRQGRPTEKDRNRAIALEAARFQNADGTLDADTKDQIADAFEVHPNTVQRKHDQAKVTRSELVAYKMKLRRAKESGRLLAGSPLRAVRTDGATKARFAADFSLSQREVILATGAGDEIHARFILGKRDVNKIVADGPVLHPSTVTGKLGAQLRMLLHGKKIVAKCVVSDIELRPRPGGETALACKLMDAKIAGGRLAILRPTVVQMEIEVKLGA